MKFLKKLETLALDSAGGPSGGIDILKARDKEVDFKDGMPSLLIPRDPNKKPKKLDDFKKGKGGMYDSDQGSYPFILPDLLSSPDRGWPQNGQNSPTRREPPEEAMMAKKATGKVEPKEEATDKTLETTKKPEPVKPEVEPETKPAPKAPPKSAKEKVTVKVTPPKTADSQPPEDVKMTVAKPKFFPELIGVVRSLFPSLKMAFPSPPTYIWNPPGEAELDPIGIKNKFKTKLPNLTWSKSYESVDTAEYQFADGSKAQFSIGLDANHLTVTFVR